MPVYQRSGSHRFQYDGSALASENCTPTSLANNIREATGGAINKSGAQIRALVAKSEEENPATPGWSLGDAKLAASRLGLTFVIKSGSGWQGVRDARAAGYGIVLQGDSEEFPTGCPGKFDGDHAIYVHPENSGTRYLKGDPICPDYQWEEAAILRAYAENFSPTVRFGYINIPVPKENTNVVQAAITSTAPATADFADGTQLYDLDGKTAIRKLTQALNDRFSPYAVGTKRAVYAVRPSPLTGSQLYLAAATDVRPITDTSPFTQAQLDAAVAAKTATLTAKVTELQATVAASAVTVSRYESLKAAIKLLLS